MTALAMLLVQGAASGMIHAASGTIASLAGLSVKMLAAARKMLAARQTRAQLRCLDDATLKDIGLHRSEIESLAVGIRVDLSRNHR
jgi:uncharacterized protein YjiS (DUF1127 family)